MVFEHIEKLKQEYTDKYVVVDDSRPELRRFQGLTGTVKTVNMSGRALVEFDKPPNTSWFDIDVDFLRVIDQPLPKQEEKPAAKAAQPAAKKAAPSALEKARSQKQPAKTTAGKMSVQEMLAAARAEKEGGAAPAAERPAAKAKEAPAKEAPPAQLSTADILAAARGEKGATSQPPAKPTPAEQKPQQKSPAKVDPGKMSTADILAAARGEKADAAPAAESAVEQPPTDQSEQPVEEEVVPAAPQPAPTQESAPPAGPIPTETDDILAYCRRVDGGG